jgi:hypothetical protein
MTEHPQLREKSVGEFAPAVQIDYFDGNSQWAKAENLEQLLPRPFLNSRRAAFRLAQNSPNLRQLLKAEQVLGLVHQPIAAMPVVGDIKKAVALLAAQAERSALADRAILNRPGYPGGGAVQRCPPAPWWPLCSQFGADRAGHPDYRARCRYPVGAGDSVGGVMGRYGGGGSGGYVKATRRD